MRAGLDSKPIFSLEENMQVYISWDIFLQNQLSNTVNKKIKVRNFLVFGNNF